MKKLFMVLSSALAAIVMMAALNVSAQQCGRQAGGALCANRLCCSEFGYCGDTAPYCGARCQSQCGGSTPTTPTTPSGTGVGRLISSSMFDQMLKYRNDPRCNANGFYLYSAFITAANQFPGFGTTGDDATRRRELAAFFGQTSHETTGGWPSAPDGPFAWGYCHSRELNRATYCSSNEYPCPAGRQYFGRGPIQLTHNYNYAKAGAALGLDLINNPDLVATDPVVSFRTAIWFWMTPQGNKPSSHDVITGRWTPSAADVSAGRAPGYGVITNIINGGLECGRGQNAAVANRIGFFRRYCDMFGIGYGNNLDCYNQRSF
uniref:chitinase n=1 Tax=Kalanchoe fedtschenkoi TaxID=63787 RepID=A0A7N1A5X5_KALFE